MAEYQRLPERKYAEAEYLFQTIEMAKSDDEFDVDFCSSPPPVAATATTTTLFDFTAEPFPPLGDTAASRFGWVRKHRNRWYRRYTSQAPPAPPSTPTSLTANNTPTPSPPTSNSGGIGDIGNGATSMMAENTITATTAGALMPAGATSSQLNDDDRLKSLLYILDYTPKYKKKLKEQQRTDAELAELFNVFAITKASNANHRTLSAGIGDGNTGAAVMKAGQPERGISINSRAIRRHDGVNSMKIVKLLPPRDFFREDFFRRQHQLQPDQRQMMAMQCRFPRLLNATVRHHQQQQQQQLQQGQHFPTIEEEEDSVSAPEYDNDDDETANGIRYRRFTNMKCSRRFLFTKRQRRFARYQHQDRMDSMLNAFDAAMSFNGD